MTTLRFMDGEFLAGDAYPVYLITVVCGTEVVMPAENARCYRYDTAMVMSYNMLYRKQRSRQSDEFLRML